MESTRQISNKLEKYLRIFSNEKKHDKIKLIADSFEYNGQYGLGCNGHWPWM